MYLLQRFLPSIFTMLFLWYLLVCFSFAFLNSHCLVLFSQKILTTFLCLVSVIEENPFCISWLQIPCLEPYSRAFSTFSIFFSSFSSLYTIFIQSLSVFWPQQLFWSSTSSIQHNILLLPLLDRLRAIAFSYAIIAFSSIVVLIFLHLSLKCLMR